MSLSTISFCMQEVSQFGFLTARFSMKNSHKDEETVLRMLQKFEL